MILIEGQYYPLEKLQDFILVCYPHLAEKFRIKKTENHVKAVIDGGEIKKDVRDKKRVAAEAFNWKELIAHVSKQKFILHHFNQ